MCTSLTLKIQTTNVSQTDKVKRSKIARTRTFVLILSDTPIPCLDSGTLCGECRSDAGVSALLNKCVTCHDGYSVLIPLLGMLYCTLAECDKYYIQSECFFGMCYSLM